MKKFKWIVEFEVAKFWIEDGFDLTDERALDMLANDLQYAYVEKELGAKVISAPPPDEIRKVQGYESSDSAVTEMSDSSLTDDAGARRMNER